MRGLSLTIILVFIFSCSQPERKLPNVIFILADDLGYADLGVYGSDFHETPNLDQMAGDGMLFTDAYASAPVCSPTRASIQTGKYPVSVGITNYIPGRKPHSFERLLAPEDLNQLALEEITLAEAFKSIDYRTASIGKWHLGTNQFLPTHQGYDINVAGNHRGSPPGYFYPYQRRDYQLEQLAETGKKNEYLTDRLTQEAIDFIKANRDSSFFLYLSYYAVHIPLQAKVDLLRKYNHKLKKGTHRHDNPVYAAMVENLDRNVGDIFKVLKQLDLDEETIVIFTSDNGGLSVKEGPHTPATTNFPLKEGKGYLSEGGIRVPLMVKWPGKIRAGAISEVPVTSIDFAPTLMQLMQIDHEPLDGISILPVLMEAGNYQERDLFWHFPHYSNQGGSPGSAIRSGDFKLVEYFENQTLELYDLQNDIGEQNNLIYSEPQLAAELFGKLNRWREQKMVKFPIPNPEYQRESLFSLYEKP